MHRYEKTISELYHSEYARLLSVLVRVFGAHNFELAEDILQEAFNKALNVWQNGIPDNPAAWLMRTAKNQAIDTIRTNKVHHNFAEDLSHQLSSEWTLSSVMEKAFDKHEIQDDQLRMIFLCCSESISTDNRLPFILKTLCGFSIAAIARALLIPEATVKKRLLRTKQKLKQHDFAFPPEEKVDAAMDTVHTVLYLLFNEGFHCSDGKRAINLTFCQEAIALLRLLVSDVRFANQETLALFALMHFHIARLEARVDELGNNIPLNLQDRQLWNQGYINTGQNFLALAKSIRLNNTGRFFIEAHIMSEHCVANSFNETNWSKIYTLYKQWAQSNDSGVILLNQAIAQAYAGDLEQAIKKVIKLKQHPNFKHSHMPLATLAHLYAKSGDREQAYRLAEQAKSKGGTLYEHQLMMQQIESLLLPLNEKA